MNPSRRASPLPGSADPGRPLAGRELLVAWLVALALFAWPLRAGLFDSGRVLFGVDTATAQLPWRDAPGGSDQVLNPELADQGMVFYPAYRFALREWSVDGPPLWNPLVYAGAPAIGNPQLGLLDPQVLLQVALGRLCGPAAFDWSFALLLWLRLAAAAAGAYALARRLGLGLRGASLAAVGFSTAGFVALWANHSLGHVTPFLPWVLFALEGLRGARARGRSRAFVAAALLFAAAIYGGHPETAFDVGLAAGVWSLALFGESRRAGLAALGALALGTLLAAPCLAPFAEYLANSGALIARRASEPGAEPDWIALGLFVLAAGGVWRWRELAAARPSFGGVSAAVGAGLLLAVCLALAFARDLAPSSRLLLWPRAFGVPWTHAIDGGYRGGGQFLEQASAWLAAPVALLALAGLLLRPAADGTGLRRRATCAALGVVALLLALRAPGVIEVYRELPLVGLAASVRCAVVSALCLSLLAGEALERAPRGARVAAVAALALLVPLALRHAAPEPVALAAGETQAGDPDDGVVLFLERPAPVLSGAARLSGWIHPGLAVHAAELAIEQVGTEDARAESVPVELARTSADAAAHAGAPAGALSFRVPRLWLEHADEGALRFTLRLFDAQGTLMGERVAGVSLVVREPAFDAATLVVWVCAALFVLGLAARAPAFALVLFAALQGLAFLDGVHAAIPRERAFPETATERILARELGSRRYFAEPGVLPANTGMVRGLCALDGYDGLDPASFDGYRAAALRPGVQPLIGFSARNAELASAPFRLLGVGALVLAAPLEAPGFELVASPEPGAPERAECWIYRATDPLPRAFCVPRIVPRAEALADLARFDPREAAFLEDGASVALERPFARADVREVRWSNDSVELAVELDGQGLFVLTEQHFPGWTAHVDGAPREVLRANSIFRAVPLEPGAHRIVFRYRPATWRLGLALAAAGALALAAAAWALARARPTAR